jgi:hypothetical protein
MLNLDLWPSAPRNLYCSPVWDSGHRTIISNSEGTQKSTAICLRSSFNITTTIPSSPSITMASSSAASQPSPVIQPLPKLHHRFAPGTRIIHRRVFAENDEAILLEYAKVITSFPNRCPEYPSDIRHYYAELQRRQRRKFEQVSPRQGADDPQQIHTPPAPPFRSEDRWPRGYLRHQ